MDTNVGLGIYIDTARYAQSNMLFKNGDITKERVVSCYELALFLKDGGFSVINGKKHMITAGSVRFHRPGDRVYSCRFNDIYVMHFSTDIQNKEKAFDHIPSFIRLTEFEKEQDIFKRLTSALIEQDDFECMSCFWELLSRIKNQSLLLETNNKQRTVSRIKKHIEDNFSRQITLAEIADNFHLHPIYMQRKFKKEVGLSPADYQKTVRLSKAKAYLLESDLTVDEISDLCGFCNSSYFIKIFKSAEGLTPFQFRQKTYSLDL